MEMANGMRALCASAIKPNAEVSFMCFSTKATHDMLTGGTEQFAQKTLSI